MSCLLAASARAEVERAASDSFVIVFNRTINATPAAVYAAITASTDGGAAITPIPAMPRT
jgi:hypothetical protein